MSRAAARRLSALVGKESRQILRDPSSIAIAFVLPAILLFIFGYGVSLDAEGVPVAVVVEQPSPQADSLAAAFAGSPSFDPVYPLHRTPAQRLLRLGEVRAVVVVPASFEADLARGDAAVQVLLDGTDANTARIVSGYADGVLSGWLADLARERGARTAPVIEAESRIWFNPAVRSRNFLIPGLVAIVMTLTGALLTSLLVAREYDRGTIETLMATPAGVGEILAGKVVPTFLLGMASMGLSVAMAVWLFDVPLRGSFLVLAGASALFLTAALGLGLVISAATKDQFVAGQLAILVTFLPAFLLSGFIFNIDAMPPAIQAVSHLVAARYFIAIAQTVFLVGTEWSVILPNAAALAVMGVAFLGLARALLVKRLG
ncbi:MAG: ABC transporter permease [Azospirillaceae bacterium]